jgi:SAM-dependent methyltransferase
MSCSAYCIHGHTIGKEDTILMKEPMRINLTQRFLHLLFKKGHYADQLHLDKEEAFKNELVSSRQFFCRFENKVDFKDKTVLDVGCGLGALCYYMALNGARNVVGVDINRASIAFAESRFKEYPVARGVLTFGLPDETNPETYDLVLSKDSFEHFENPEDFMVILQRYLKPRGKLVIGFSPLWKSPYGGHIREVTKWPLPWLHLIFPEQILMEELRRYLKDESVVSFKQVAGGLNKMTLRRYLRIVESQKLEVEYMKTNVGSTLKDRFVLSVFKILSLIPGLKEYFTVNLYSILRTETCAQCR